MNLISVVSHALLWPPKQQPQVSGVRLRHVHYKVLAREVSELRLSEFTQISEFLAKILR